MTTYNINGLIGIMVTTEKYNIQVWFYSTLEK